ncbi:MAG: helix-turn-helix transcriptional regulator [Chitinophagaceae bacterium]|nr:helix-turn-helix transcriptional regulator [Chitinophagaceae bacterium]
MTEKTIHEGRNVKRFREMLGIKQDTLAAELGLSQQAVSQLEQKEKIDSKILDDVAKILKVPAEAIKNFDEDTALNVISNTFHEAAFINSAGTFNVNPIDKWLEVLEENKKLYAALLKEKDEKIALLERLLDKK